MKKCIYFFIILFLVTCSKNNKSTDATSQNDTSISFTTLKKEIIENGDIGSYETLFIAYLDEPYPEEFLYYALIMANQYNYPQAYYDVYNCLCLTYINNLEKMDENTANIAIQYLLKAKELAHHQALDEVKEYNIKYNDKTNKDQIIKIYGE